MRLRSIEIASTGRSLRSSLAAPFRREILRQSALDHLRKHRMQPTDRAGASRSELVVASCQQPQDLTVILEFDLTQVSMP